MTLTLFSKMPCEAGKLCAAVMEEYHQVNVDLMTIETDGCGAVIYTGVLDKTPMDGLREEIVVVDHCQNICQIYLPFATNVSYTIFNPWTQQSLQSTFAGEPLFIQPNFF